MPRDRRSPRAVRRILCLFPRYAPSFGTFEHAYALVPGVRGFLPPQGLLSVASYLPRGWEVRFVDENVRPVRTADLAWADAVFLSGMHVQRHRIEALTREAHRFGKVVALGGPSVSACPDWYPEVDLLHVGEIGDATDALIERLDADVRRPSAQIVFQTADRVPLDDLPMPAYGSIDLNRYFIGSVQWSSGCPFRCEFCDIPELYGRNPRLKSPERVLAELDAMMAAGPPSAVYFVDDNFIGNRRAASDLLDRLLEWQERRGHPLRFACEATLDLAGCDELLDKMRRASFQTVFCGIETPSPEALQAMKKTQNLRRPILDAVATLNAHGMEVVSGIILGLDTDRPDTGDHVLEFIDRSSIPMLTINLLYALPKTPLFRRLETEGRILPDGDRLSNVDFRLPYDQVVASWRRVIGQAYRPERLFERFARQGETTYPNRFRPKRTATARQVLSGLHLVSRLLWRVGVRADYGRWYRPVARRFAAAGLVEEAIHVGLVGHHLIQFSRECARGDGEASFYSDRGRVALPERGGPTARSA